MKRLLVLLTSLCLLSCNKVQWVRTTDGIYIYGKLPKNSNLVWEGETLGSLASGKGDVVFYDNNGAEMNRISVETKLGAISDYNYVPVSVGHYIGTKKDNLPHGFGSLIKNDSLYLGTFKKGTLSTGNVEIYYLNNSAGALCFSGWYKKGKADGFGKRYVNGVLCYEGNYKKGRREGFGREYVAGQLAFDGSFKLGLRNGNGKEYRNGVLVYNGEWQKGLRDGYGIEYNDRGVLLYDGSWNDGLYHGKGKLYENGQCIEGKFEKGRLTKTISSSVFKEICNSARMWFSDLDSLEITESTTEASRFSQPASQIEFIETLNEEIEQELTKEFNTRVQKRFGFWHLIRMVVQPWFKSDIKRANAAQNYFCKNVNSSEIENLINSKIDFYNVNTNGGRLNYIKLDKLPYGAIVDSDIAINVFEREAMETTDMIVGILVDILICFVIAFIIGFIIGFAIPSLIPYVFIVDIAMTVIAFGVGLYLSVFRTTVVSMELERAITQMLVDNYMQFLDSQNVILQMIGLL